MSHETVHAHPGGLDFHLYPTNPLPVRFTWPDTESLTGRTFEVRLAGIEDPLTVTVVGQVMSFTLPTEPDGTVKRWELWETTDDAPIPVSMGGKAVWLNRFDADVDALEVTVNVKDTIDVTVEIIAAGPPGVDGEPGPPGGSYRHVQSIPAAVWTVTHNLGYRPGGIYVEDSAHTQLSPRVIHVDANTLTLSFFIAGAPVATGGEADIS